MCEEMSLAQTLMMFSFAFLVMGAIILAVNHRLTYNRIKRLRAERGLYAEVGSFAALDEKFQRRSR